jgi:hypothetical protein
MAYTVTNLTADRLFIDGVNVRPGDQVEVAEVSPALAVLRGQSKISVVAAPTTAKAFESNPQTVAYTLTLADADKAVQMNLAGANALTVPLHATVPLPVGTLIRVEQMGAGKTTLTPFSGVTIRSRGGLLGSNGQYAVMYLRKIGLNEWIADGDLAA